MSNTRRNIIANYFCQAWTGLIGFAFVPLYVKFLGIESYGVVGIFTLLQAWLSLLDMGLTPLMSREMARFIGGAHTPSSIRRLLRTIEYVYFGIALIMAAGVWGLSDFLSTSWLKADRLPASVVATAIAVMGIVVAIRFCESLYRGALYGLQKQVWYSVSNSVMMTIRSVGAVLVIAFLSPTVSAFFWWQAIVSVLTLAIFSSYTYRLLPKVNERIAFSLSALKGKVGFARHVMVNTLLALLLTQVDKLLLSRALTLAAFGYYTLASSVGAALYMLVTPLTNAVYPRMTELFTKENMEGLISTYHKGAQWATALVVPVGLTIAMFPQKVVYVWSGDASLAFNVAPILTPIMLGTVLNSVMYMPFQLQLAFGLPQIAVYMNTVAVLILLPALFFIIPVYGAVGAAWIWVILNIGYIGIGIQWMHSRILKGEKLSWYIRDIMIPSLGCLAIGLGKMIEPMDVSRMMCFVFLGAVYGISAVATALLSSHVRNHVIILCKRFLLK